MSVKVLKICISEWKHESRDKRELAVYRDLGAEPIVLAKGAKEDKTKVDMVDGFKVFRHSTRPCGNKVTNSFNRFVSVILWSRYVRKLQPNIISGHDLIALFIGWLSNFGRRDKAKLIYDAHEFELERNAKRNKIHRWLIRHLERFLMKRCIFSIMVNDTIADEMQRIHNLKIRPIVVRNILNKWELDSVAIQSVRKKFRQILGASHDIFFVMYHGAVMPGRGIETVLDVIDRKPDVAGIILGDGEAAYLNSLKIMVKERGMGNRVIFHPAVPLEKLRHYVAAANVGLITLDLKIKSYYYSLPNKFFEYIQALIPLIIYDLPEMRKIIEKYDIGLICKENSTEGVCECIDIIRNAPELYQQFKDNLIIAKEDLCWDNERNILITAYTHLIMN